MNSTNPQKEIVTTPRAAAAFDFMTTTTETEPSNSWEQLADAAMARLLSWQLPLNERLIVGWIVELSYRRGREQVCVPTQKHFARLTGIDEADVSRALKGLQAAGLLQISGPRNGTKFYRLLPNGRLIEPEPIADPAAVRFALQEIEQMNALGPGYEPGGQRRMAIVTTEEQLAVEQAAASRDLAVDGTRFLRAPHLGNFPRSEPGILGISQDLGERNEPATDAGAYARAQRLNVSSPRPLTCKRLDVEGNERSGAEGGGAAVAAGTEQYAFDEVRSLVPPEEFEPWIRKWRSRCGLARALDPQLRPQPKLIIEAAAEVKRDIREGKTVTNIGGSIVNRVKRWLGPLAHTFRLFIV